MLWTSDQGRLYVRHRFRTTTRCSEIVTPKTHARIDVHVPPTKKSAPMRRASQPSTIVIRMNPEEVHINPRITVPTTFRVRWITRST